MILYLENTTVIEFVLWIKDKAGKYGFILLYDNAGFKSVLFSTSTISEMEKNIISNESPIRIYLSKIEPSGIAYDYDGLFIIEKVGLRLKICPKAYNAAGKRNLEPILEEISKDWPESRSRLSKEIELLDYDDNFDLVSNRINDYQASNEIMEIKELKNIINDLVEKINNGHGDKTAIKNEDLPQNTNNEFTNKDISEMNTQIIKNKPEKEQWQQVYKEVIPDIRRYHEIIELYNQKLTIPEIGEKLGLGSKESRSKSKYQTVKNYIQDIRKIAKKKGGEDLVNVILPYRNIIKNKNK